MTNFMDEIKQAISNKKVKIVLPEGTDERVLKAARMLHEEGIVTPILIGAKELVEVAANQASINWTELKLLTRQ
jgi:phosphate acetyltransferase